MNDETWEPARLIPVSGLGGQQEKERRGASALLAVLGAVDEFGKAIVRNLGAPAGRISTFCEVPFELADGRKVRVDGVITVKRGKKTWTLLVEVKTGSAELDVDQIESYLEVSKENGFDGLLTVSNQIARVSGHHPVQLRNRRLSRIGLFHLSWSRILSEAVLVHEHKGVSDPDQAWILGELIRYLQYEGSGALSFDDMGPNWTTVRNAARQETLRLRDTGIRETATRWDQLIQFLCLRLGARLGEPVKPYLSRKERNDPDLHTATLSKELVDAGSLSGALTIPNAVGPVYLKALLRRMVGQASVTLTAPELKKSTARVNWLLRQLRDAPEDLRIDVAFHHSRATSSELLSRVANEPKSLLPASDMVPRSFTVTLARNVGSNRGTGRKGFITDISSLLDEFYREVVQDLSEWTPPAPHLAPGEERRTPEQSVEPVSSVAPDAEPPSINHIA